MTKSQLPPTESDELAEDLLAKFPNVNRANLLKKMVAHYFFLLRHGNKREEREACEFLNKLQAKARLP